MSPEPKLEELCAGCYTPQTSDWNDSDGGALALVFAQEHGAGLDAWQKRARGGDSDSVNPVSNPGPQGFSFKKKASQHVSKSVLKSLAGGLNGSVFKPGLPPSCENASNRDPFRMLCIALINQVNRLARSGHVSREK
jgi:hypothetical protein